MKQDRFLMAFLGLIGLMVVLALVLFFVRAEPQEYGPENDPEGVLRNYVLALQKDDYERAYGYLWESEEKPTFAAFHQMTANAEANINQSGVRIGDVTVSADQASVDLVIVHSAGDPFERGWNEPGSALLSRQDGQWKIMSMPYPYWGWDWYVKK